MPLISIIVPVYKVKEVYLRQCLDSLVSQTFYDIEIILVDDGTPDNGGVISDEYARLDKRVKVIHQENLGVSAARNHGMEATTGEWITFVDADDWIELNACEKLASIIRQEKENIELLLFGLNVGFSNGEMENPFWSANYAQLDQDERAELQLQLLYISSSRFSPPCNTVAVAHCKLYKTEFLKNYKMKYDTNLALSEDGVFVFWALERASKVIYINEFLYHYRKNPESATRRYRPTAALDCGKALSELEKCLIKSGKGERFYLALYYRAIMNIFFICNQQICNTENRDKHKKRIYQIKNICNSYPYSAALEKISMAQYCHKKGYIQKLCFCLLKWGMYRMFYYFRLLRNKFLTII